MRIILALTLLLALPAQSADAPFLWRLDGAQATHYFIGSVHLLPDSARLPAQYNQAFKATQGLVFETDIAALSQASVQQDLLNAAQARRGLRKEVGADLYGRVLAYNKTLGLPETTCDKFKAWFCAMTLEVVQFVRAGFKPELGVDQQLHTRALLDNSKRLHALETIDQHLDLFTQMPAVLSRRFLEATLDEAGDADSPEKLLSIWRNNDLAGLTALTLEMKARQPQVYARLLAERNRAWLAPLLELLRGGEAQLVVVGAAHFAGPDGLVELLRQRGYELKPELAPAQPPAQPAVPAE